MIERVEWHRLGCIAIAGWMVMVCAVDIPLRLAAQEPTTGVVRRTWTARASDIDPRVRAYPDIDFLLEKDGKPQDLGHARANRGVPSKGRLVVWMMGYNPDLFEFLSEDGFHVLRVHYANGWFNRFGKEPPPEDTYTLGKIRLEAATGQDHSELVQIELPDGMQERVRQFLKWLAQEHPDEGWHEYLRDGGTSIDWDRVVLSGASHGATTSARFALHQRVDRVVLFCGPRDQYESWQSLPSATPRERFFGFTHTLDTGWSGDHYCRSWQMLGLHDFGPLVDVDSTPPPYAHSRRLLTSADVGNDAKRAHSCVTPGRLALRNADGEALHADVWRYLFNHPTELVGQGVRAESECRLELRAPRE
jgi:hypothetical protein